MLSGLAGRLAVVTGAGSGIGQAVALKLAGFDCKVAIFDKNVDGKWQP